MSWPARTAFCNMLKANNKIELQAGGMVRGSIYFTFGFHWNIIIKMPYPLFIKMKSHKQLFDFLIIYHVYNLMPSLLIDFMHLHVFLKCGRTAWSSHVSWQKYNCLPWGKSKSRTVRQRSLMVEVAEADLGLLKWRRWVINHLTEDILMAACF